MAKEELGSWGGTRREGGAWLLEETSGVAVLGNSYGLASKLILTGPTKANTCLNRIMLCTYFLLGSSLSCVYMP